MAFFLIEADYYVMVEDFASNDNKTVKFKPTSNTFIIHTNEGLPDACKQIKKLCQINNDKNTVKIRATKKLKSEPVLLF